MKWQEALYYGISATALALVGWYCWEMHQTNQLERKRLTFSEDVVKGVEAKLQELATESKPEPKKEIRQ
jgi:predicted negative regulator of RcsB-dependent stress response